MISFLCKNSIYIHKRFLPGKSKFKNFIFVYQQKFLLHISHHISCNYIIFNKMEESPAPKFTITKWNAVALWSWEMEQDTCAICKYF